jgi:peptide/nickel transport system permease protein
MGARGDEAVEAVSLVGMPVDASLPPESPSGNAAPTLVTDAGETTSSGGTLRKMGRVFFQNRLAVVGLGILVFFVLFSFVGPHIYVTNQVTTNLLQLNEPPSWAHPLGTDDVGYDVLGRLMVAGQSSLEVGIAAALLASLMGTAWGGIAGYIGGWVDAVMMRIVDSLLAIPPLLLILTLAGIFVPTVPILVVVIAFISWMSTARLVRGESLSIRVREYVQAAKAMGSRNVPIVSRHIVPNVIGAVVVQTTFSAANAILLLAYLSFLGLGPPPPAANWGGMLSNGLNSIYDGYWWLIYPAGLAIVLTVMAFNFMGDALRDALEVRLQDR